MVWAGYRRVSRVGEREDTLISPELQGERIMAYARSRGIEVEMLPAELDVSGGKLERPILSEALQGIEEGRFEGLVVAQLDRLSRADLGDALAVIRQIEEAGGEVIAVAENFDAGTPEGRMGRNMMLSLAAMQLDRYKLQFRVVKARAVEHGIWPMPVVPLGYRRGGDRRLVPARSAAKVRRAFEARAAGASWREVASILGVGYSTAAKVIRNRVYLGEVRVDQWVNTSAHEPIMERSLWEAAQLEHPRPARRGGPGALLGGLARCLGCGYVMTRSVSAKGSIYRCTAHNKRGESCPAPAIIGERKLDVFVEERVLTELEELAVSAQERSEALSGAERALEAAEAELVAYQRATRATGLAEAMLVEGLRSRAAEVDDARRHLAEARLAVGPVPDPTTLRELWGELGVEERRHVLRGALSAVVVAKGRGPCEGRVALLSGIGEDPEEVRAAAAEHLPERA
jgi:site-specific DNA recombinase